LLVILQIEKTLALRAALDLIGITLIIGGWFIVVVPADRLWII